MDPDPARPTRDALNLDTLNLDTLRRGALPLAIPVAGLTTRSSPARHPTPTLAPAHPTRRDLLGMAGAGAVAGSPLLRALGLSWLGPVAVRHDGWRVVLTLRGRDAWTVDPRRFGGAGRVEFLPRRDGIRIALRGAVYAGTGLPADLVCELRPGLYGPTMRLRLALGGFVATVPLVRWLEGTMPARAGVELDGTACAPLDGTALTLRGRATAAFGPDGTLRLEGKDIASLHGPLVAARADTLALTPLAPDAPSLLDPPPTRRAALTMVRGAHPWSLRPAFAPSTDWTLEAAEQPFDTLTIEAGQDDRGRARHALLAASHPDRAAFTFEPTAHRLAGARRPLRLALREARYVVTGAWEGRGETAALVARLGAESAWLHQGSRGLELGDPARASGAGGDAPFELVVTRGRLTRLHCAPSLRGVAVSLPDAITSPARLRDETRLALLWGAVEPDMAARADGSPEVRVLPLRLDGAPSGPRPPRHGRGAHRVRLAPTTPFSNRRLLTAPPPAPTIPYDPFAVLKASGDADVYLYFKNESRTFEIVRPDDLAVLTMELGSTVNLTERGTPDGQQLVRVDGSKDSYIVLTLPPQHLGEETWVESSGNLSNAPQPPAIDPTHPLPPYQVNPPGENTDNTVHVAYTILSGPSKLVFHIPARDDRVTAEKGIPFTLEAILQACSRDYGLHTVDNASAGQPDPLDTAIEMPYRVVISPFHYPSPGMRPSNGTQHQSTPVVGGSRTELWHTRLYSGSSASDAPLVSVLNSPDYPKPTGSNNGADLFPMPLTPRDRDQLVHLAGPGQPSANALRAEGLMLSALGGWMKVQGGWNVAGTGNSLAAYRQEISMGRDQYVSTLNLGYLFPFGHRASLVAITQRKFKAAADGDVAAFLAQRLYVVVRQAEVRYDASPDEDSSALPLPADGRGLPFRSVRLLTLTTPDLDRPSDQSLFWIDSSGPYRFHAVATDWEGRTVHLSPQLAFVANGPDATAWSAFLDQVDDNRSTIQLDRQQVAFADSTAPGDTRFEADDMSIWAERQNRAPGTDLAPFTPRMMSARVSIPALKAFLGNALTPHVEYYPTYLSDGFDNASNRGEILFTLPNADEHPSLTFDGNAARSGGLATPNFRAGAISRRTGLVGLPPPSPQGARLLAPIPALARRTPGGAGRAQAPVSADAPSISPQDALKDFAQGGFDPAAFFDKEAKILGSFALTEIIAKIDRKIDPNADGAKSAPHLTTITHKDDKGTPTAVETRFHWEPQVHSFPPDKFPVFEAYDGTDHPARLVIDASTVAPLNGNPPTYKTTGTLSSFGITLGGIVTLAFDSLTFTSASGQKPNLAVNLKQPGPIVFNGPLAFVNPLERFLSAFVDPPYLDATADHVAIGYTQSIPTIPIGSLILQNLALSAGFTVPLDGRPIAFDFAFSSPDHPFVVTYDALGGSGSFHVAVGPHGLLALEASLAAEANLSLDLGVASGGVFTRVGIQYKKENDAVTLTAFMRMGGAMEVLGLISYSVDFYLGLDYTTTTDAQGNSHHLLSGEATLTVDVHVAFFSKTVSLSVHRELQGGDPTFDAIISPDDWQAYLGAFAS